LHADSDYRSRVLNIRDLDFVDFARFAALDDLETWSNFPHCPAQFDVLANDRTMATKQSIVYILSRPLAHRQRDVQRRH